jgi:hypothetical protein
LRKEIGRVVSEKARQVELSKGDFESLIAFLRDKIDDIEEIHFTRMAEYIIGLSEGMRGLGALSRFNPDLHKSLEQLYGDIIGIANNTQMMEAVRNRFAIAAVNLEKAEHNLAALRLNTETWFNESMDRLSGWYKRKAVILAFLIGLGLSSILNVDSIDIATHLWKEPSVRQALAATATEFAESYAEAPDLQDGGEPVTPAEAIEYFQGQFTGLNIPLGWTFETVTIDRATHTCSLIPFGENKVWGIEEKVKSQEEMIAEIVKSLTANEEPMKDPVQCQKISNAPTDTDGWLLKIMGILLSAGAAAQGSPFWFDLLKKMVNVRGAGANPDEKKK